MNDLSNADPGEITVLLAELRAGDQSASSRLAPLVLQSLRQIAARQLGMEKPGHSLQPTLLVNDAYLALLRQNKDWRNRSHFFAVASALIRQILVDHARTRNALKRGGGAVRLDLRGLAEPGTDPEGDRNIELLALDQALSRLFELDERQARIVEMRFFGGMNDKEIASVLEVSVRTVVREWSLARAWLHGQLS